MLPVLPIFHHATSRRTSQRTCRRTSRRFFIPRRDRNELELRDEKFQLRAARRLKRAAEEWKKSGDRENDEGSLRRCQRGPPDVSESRGAHEPGEPVRHCSRSVRAKKKSGTAMTDETLMDARHDRSIIIDYNARPLRSFRVGRLRRRPR